jgi:cellulose synthase/poly-beta-1,6-N-acetylglucosamine synthase-like glycosyltransferase
MIPALILENFIYYLTTFIFFYFLITQSNYLLLLIVSIPDLVKRFKETQMENLEPILKSESVPKISIIIPMFNEEKDCIGSVNNLLNLSYRYKEIIVINDGSTDQTFNLLEKTFHLLKVPPNNPPIIPTKKIRNYYRSKEIPELLVVDKEHGGKVDSNNAGINTATSDYFINIDADTVLPEGTLEILIRPFFMRKNVIGCGGSVGIANDISFRGNKIQRIYFPKKWLVRLQTIEYLRAFLFGRLGFRHLGGCLIISGCFGLYDRNAILSIGGYKREIGDDVDLVVRLHKAFLQKKIPYVIEFIPDLIALTEVPETLKALKRQRERWQKGVLDVVFNNLSMLFNPRYKKVAFFSFPNLFFIETLSPIVEILGYFTVAVGLYSNSIDKPLALWLLLLAFGFPILLSYSCILLQAITFRWYTSFNDLFLMLISAIFEQLGYRQLLVFFRLKAFFYHTPKKWIQNKRRGFKSSR